MFNAHHSEHEILRYLRSLADKDLALDRTMIPLGLCTTELNATVEMLPVTWPELSDIHPFAPADQTVGYHRVIDQLEQMLHAATGYAVVNLQPSVGSQGEYVGLLAIHAYHASCGEAHRNVCLIPLSVHGTNPASAQMAGMQVVVVACDEYGNVDPADLEKKVAGHNRNLAATMITYPSMHGIFEGGVKRIYRIVYDHGGQVYMDGANTNAAIGTTVPGHFGGDASHLNLHKTFCIPYGSGGLGAGPVAMSAHLAPLPPGHATSGGDASQNIGSVSASASGSTPILLISWMYAVMTDAADLTVTAEMAILTASCVIKRFVPYYPVPYTGAHGLMTHECILGVRPLQKESGISDEGIVERLMDFGFHAPTMSFPVPGTLMTESTESEPKMEFDCFINAMVAIRGEIDRMTLGEFDRRDNPLKHAPHTAAVVMADDWSRKYTREQATYLVVSLRAHKCWLPVGRTDNVYSGRNLFCVYVSMGEYVQG